MAVISVALVSDNAGCMEALKNILGKVPNIYKVVDTVNLDKALDRVLTCQPELVLFAVKNGKIPVSLLIDIKECCPQSVLVLVTKRNEPDIVADAFRIGADACVQATPGFLTRILELVCRGGIVVYPRVLKDLVQPVASPGEQIGSESLPEDITKRESEVYHLLLKRYSNKEIAGKLYISESTVKSHVRSILRKMGAKSRKGLEVK
ncbi:MAG: response regulator transcription factor [Heliobacteriaceae bacterium]|nr:response regulator transcription factor [Heliobacteriaceae bacterium]